MTGIETGLIIGYGVILVILCLIGWAVGDCKEMLRDLHSDVKRNRKKAIDISDRHTRHLGIIQDEIKEIKNAEGTN